VPRVTTIPPPSNPTPKPYTWDWNSILNGQIWQLERGVDYGDATEFRIALDAECGRRRIKSVRVNATNDTITVQVAPSSTPVPEPIVAKVENVIANNLTLGMVVTGTNEADRHALSEINMAKSAESFRSDRNLQEIWLRVMGEDAPPTGPKPSTRPSITEKLPPEPDLSEVKLDYLLAEIVRRHARPPVLVPLVETVVTRKRVVDEVEATPNNGAKSPEATAHTGRVSMSDLMGRGLLLPSDMLLMSVNDRQQEAYVTAEGGLMVGNTLCKSISAAAEVASEMCGKKVNSINGWTAFHLIRDGADMGEMMELREKFLNPSASQCV
jgi:hypothetical protein